MRTTIFNFWRRFLIGGCAFMIAAVAHAQQQESAGRQEKESRQEEEATQKKAQTSAVSAQDSDQQPGASAASRSDTELQRVLEKRLDSNETVPAHAIDVSVQYGGVTLSGSVESLAAKEAATRIAEGIRGVKLVRNNLEVNGRNKSAGQIRREVQLALALDPATESYEVFVTVDEDGRVRLSGRVDSFHERRLAQEIATNVRGVRSIENQIKVSTFGTRPDHEIQEDVRSRLLRDAKVNASGISVDVDNGKVLLTGNVNSPIQRRWAIWDSWVAGARGVDASGLQVQEFHAEARQQRRDEFARKDPTQQDEGSGRAPSAQQGSGEERESQVREAVENAFQNEPRLKSQNIDVEVESGKVVLSGTVDNLKAKRTASQLASEQSGVQSIQNFIRVRSGSIPNNEVLARRVRQAIERDPYLEQSGVQVTATNGKVWLGGSVDTRFAKRRADDIASRTRGVLAVQNNLAVQPELAVYGYYSTTTPIYIVDPANDAEIAANIENQMFWSPFVEADEVSVSVQGGVATLTGAVESLSERRSAIENAYEGGARQVRSQIVVEPNDDLF